MTLQRFELLYCYKLWLWVQSIKTLLRRFKVFCPACCDDGYNIATGTYSMFCEKKKYQTFFSSITDSIVLDVLANEQYQYLVFVYLIIFKNYFRRIYGIIVDGTLNLIFFACLMCHFE